MTDKTIKPGSKIRRKQHKNKTRASTQPVVTVVRFYKSDGMDMVELKDKMGKAWYMSFKGLDWYELVTD